MVALQVDLKFRFGTLTVWCFARIDRSAIIRRKACQAYRARRESLRALSSQFTSA
jgi:hypothetical protein